MPCFLCFPKRLLRIPCLPCPPDVGRTTVQGTLALASEEDWVSDGLYEGSSMAASDAAHGEGLPAEVHRMSKTVFHRILRFLRNDT